MNVTHPRLIAHRGYAAHYPENTQLAIAAAVEAGAHYIEFDVLLSKDRVPVLFHDRDLQRMCGQHGAVHDYTLAELRRFSVSQFDDFGYRFAGNPITTLQEIVNYLSLHPVVFAFVELKRQSMEVFGIETVLGKVLPMLESICEQAIVISYSLESLVATRERSALPIGAVFDDWRARRQPLVEKLRAEYLFTDIEQLPRFGRLMCEHCQLAVYECADPVRAMRVHKRGVHFVETFAFAEMRDALELMTDWP